LALTSPGPTWKMADGFAIVGEVIAKADAPEKDAIQWLLLRGKAHEGQGILADAVFIRRTETRGGVAPITACDASHVSEQARMRSVGKATRTSGTCPQVAKPRREGREEQSRRNPESIGRFDPATF
jgi:hypothetical protein